MRFVTCCHVSATVYYTFKAFTTFTKLQDDCDPKCERINKHLRTYIWHTVKVQEARTVVQQNVNTDVAFFFNLTVNLRFMRFIMDTTNEITRSAVAAGCSFN